MSGWDIRGFSSVATNYHVSCCGLLPYISYPSHHSPEAPDRSNSWCFFHHQTLPKITVIIFCHPICKELMFVNRAIKVVIVIDDSDSVSRTSILKFCIFDSEIDGGSAMESNPISQSALVASDIAFSSYFSIGAYGACFHHRVRHRDSRYWPVFPE